MRFRTASASRTICSTGSSSARAFSPKFKLTKQVVDGRFIQLAFELAGQHDAEQFAAVQEQPVDELAEEFQIGNRLAALALERDSHDGRVHLRPGPEHLRRHHAQQFHLALALHPAD